MSYTVEQKINGRIYLYEVVSYWDKEKKQPRQKRKYLGPKEKRKTPKTYDLKHLREQLIHKNYGNIFLLDDVSEKIGLKKILSQAFPSSYKNILMLAFYTVCTGEPFYMFPYWQKEQHLPKGKILHSPDISALCNKIGLSQKSIMDFFKQWTEHCSPRRGIYFDITSISSYSSNIDYVEWGYNRDKEDLPQINMGLMCSKESSLPLYYHIYPGSIVDVTTLNNSLKYLSAYNLKDVILVLDRGFFSKNNLIKLSENKNNLVFLQPLTFSTKAARALIKSNKKKIMRMANAFKYNEEILHYQDTILELGDRNYYAHIFYNEKAAVDGKHNFLGKILDIEKVIGSKKFGSIKDYLKFRQNSIQERYVQFFKLNKTSMQIERNLRTISKHLLTRGYFVIISNSGKIERSSVLSCYRERDLVEKMFDLEKNKMDGKRLRVHSKYNMDGKIFLKFISLILYSYISKIMGESKLFEKYSVKELIAILSKIKYTSVDKDNDIITEITKTQRNILKAFKIENMASNSQLLKFYSNLGYKY